MVPGKEEAGKVRGGAARLCPEAAGDVEDPIALPSSPLDPPEKLRRRGSRARLSVCERLSGTGVWVVRQITAAVCQGAASGRSGNWVIPGLGLSGPESWSQLGSQDPEPCEQAMWGEPQQDGVHSW
ncbi:cold shock domain-containing protein C2 isoform X2 [Meriones unguiculatus]|uniref:cold shock domain-containing protein C2 isoform X2 n=1 Tax=Meriones unguiculatus TaxID=10047 RepID=UPI00293F780E|nr:cold shock domain-containing protein C2 isoform X2 [Meriones unguiculatus]